MRLCTRRHTAAIAAAGVAVLLLAGCAATPTPAPSRYKSSLSTDTPTTAITATAVPEPTSAAIALAAANEAVDAYYTSSFANRQSGGRQFATVAPLLTGEAYQNEQILSGYLRSKGLHFVGAPTGWTADYNASSAGTEVRVAGGRVPFGAAHLVGCITAENHPVGQGAPTAAPVGHRTALAWDVLFNAAEHRWQLQNSTFLTAKQAGVKCG